MKTIDELGLTQYKTQQVAWEVLNAIHQMFQSNMGKSLLEIKITNLLLDTYVQLVEIYHRDLEEVSIIKDNYNNVLRELAIKDKVVDDLYNACKDLEDIKYKYDNLREEIKQLHVRYVINNEID